jgi:Putative adhesin
MLEDTFVIPSDPRLNVSVPAGEIDIETQPGPEASVRLTPLGDNEASREAVERAKVELHGSELVVEVKHKRFGLSGRARVRAEIRCPEGTDARVHTASSDVQARGRLGDAKAHVASGDVRLEHVGGRLQAHSASGDFEVGFVGDDASIHSASGDVVIRRSDAGVEIRSASGDVEVLDAGSGPVKVHSASGDVRIGVRAGRRVAVDVRTVSGDASSEIPLDGAEGEAADAPLVEIKVNGVSGDVRIERAVEVEAA